MSARDRLSTRKSTSLRRSGGTVPPRPVFHVFVEGKVTELEYLDWLADLDGIRNHVSLIVENPSNSPFHVVNAAAGVQAEPGDESWAVFDVEAPQPHGDLHKAIELAGKSQVSTAISNPCFELWLILHEQEQTAYLSTKEAQSLQRQLTGATNKHLPPGYGFTTEQLDKACSRAKALRTRHAGNGTHFPEDNPSTTVDQLVTHVLDAATRIGWEDLARAEQRVTVQVQGPAYFPAVTVNGLPLPRDAFPSNCYDDDALRQAVITHLDSFNAGINHSGWLIEVASGAEQPGS